MAGAAADARTAVDCESLTNALQLMRIEADAGNWQEALKAHLEFHQALLLATHLPALIVILRPMQLVVLTSSLLPEFGNIRLHDLPEHEALLAAVVRRDARRSATCNGAALPFCG